MRWRHPARCNVYAGTYDEDVNANNPGVQDLGESSGATNIRGPVGGSRRYGADHGEQYNTCRIYDHPPWQQHDRLERPGVSIMPVSRSRDKLLPAP